ncbi:hypothetical protein DCAR_0104516 [Daucus carota subsp. sativus]|uniref:Uncharacterized protein n=1 Tax=Daucus carota subsp. sativus TaxID=79200 RepID=A0A166IWH0_DAUCS|nr:hypothetical protein DCAR_0104516 [Daucus carota subsp. sativus]
MLRIILMIFRTTFGCLCLYICDPAEERKIKNKAITTIYNTTEHNLHTHTNKQTQDHQGFIYLSVLKMALFSMFLGCFLDSSPRLAVEGDEKLVASTPHSLEKLYSESESESESESFSDQDVKREDITNMISNNSKGAHIVVSYFPIGSRLSCI